MTKVNKEKFLNKLEEAKGFISPEVIDGYKLLFTLEGDITRNLVKDALKEEQDKEVKNAILYAYSDSVEEKKDNVSHETNKKVDNKKATDKKDNKKPKTKVEELITKAISTPLIVKKTKYKRIEEIKALEEIKINDIINYYDIYQNKGNDNLTIKVIQINSKNVALENVLNEEVLYVNKKDLEGLIKKHMIFKVEKVEG